MADQKSPRWQKLAALAAVVAVGGGAAGWLAVQPRDALARALERVSEGELHEACPELEEALSDPASDESRPGIDDAKYACVEHEIEHALSEEDLGEREHMLLALAAPGPHLYPTREQLEHIERETAELPGAIDKGLGRIAPHRYEVQGALSTKEIRELVRGLDAPIRGCHAKAALAEPGLQGQYFIHLDVAADGSVTGVRPGGSEISPTQSAVLTECLAFLFRAQTLPAKDRGSRAGAEFRIRPFSGS